MMCALVALATSRRSETRHHWPWQAIVGRTISVAATARAVAWVESARLGQLVASYGLDPLEAGERVQGRFLDGECSERRPILRRRRGDLRRLNQHGDRPSRRSPVSTAAMTTIEAATSAPTPTRRRRRRPERGSCSMARSRSATAVALLGSPLRVLLQQTVDESGERLGKIGLEIPDGAWVAWRSLAAASARRGLPWKGERPVQISYSSTPSEKRSERASSACPPACSGDIALRVPTSAPSRVSASSGVELPRRLARPKSRILTWPAGVTMTFWVLRSRWIRSLA